MLALGLILSPASVRALTLEEALADLLQRHPQIQAAKQQLEAADKAIGVARSKYWPTVSLSGNDGYEHVNSPDRRSVQGEPSGGPTNRVTLSVVENLFDGFSRESGKKQAEINRDIADANLRNVRQSVLIDGVNAYIGVVRAAKLVGLTRENERTTQTQLNLEDERVRRGSGIAVDVLQAKARLQLAKEKRVTYEGAQREANARYQQVFDAAAEVASMADPVLPLGLLPENLKDAVDAAQKENPVVTASQQQVDLAQERRRGAASGYYPRIDLVGRRNYENNVDGVAGMRNDYAVLLQFTWELFSGFATQSGIAQASAEFAAARSNLSFTNRKVVEEVELAWQALETARERQSLLENAVNIAGEVFDARKRLRDVGRETALNVLDAQSEFYNARINQVSAGYDARIAAYRLLAAMGRMHAEKLSLATAEKPKQ